MQVIFLFLKSLSAIPTSMTPADAAVAVSAVLNVTESSFCGIGGSVLVLLTLNFL